MTTTAAPTPSPLTSLHADLARGWADRAIRLILLLLAATWLFGSAPAEAGITLVATMLATAVLRWHRTSLRTVAVGC